MTTAVWCAGQWGLDDFRWDGVDINVDPQIFRPVRLPGEHGDREVRSVLHAAWTQAAVLDEDGKVRGWPLSCDTPSLLQGRTLTVQDVQQVLGADSIEALLSPDGTLQCDESTVAPLPDNEAAAASRRAHKWHSMHVDWQSRVLAISHDFIALYASLNDASFGSWQSDGVKQLHDFSKPGDDDAFTAWTARELQVAAGGGHFLVWGSAGPGSRPSTWSRRHQLWSVGDNRFGQLGRRTVGSDVSGDEVLRPVTFFSPCEAFPAEIKRAAAGLRHSAALTADGDIYTWGWNGERQYGAAAGSMLRAPQLLEWPHGRVDAQGNPDDQEATFLDVDCGHDHTTVITERDRSVWTAGLNRHGQLGRKTAASQPDEPPEGDHDSGSDWERCAPFGTDGGPAATRVVCGPWATLVVADARPAS